MFHTTPDVIEDGETTSYNPLCLLAETDNSFCAYLVLQLYVVAFLSHSQYTFDAAVVNPRLYGHFYVQSPFQLPMCTYCFPMKAARSYTVLAGWPSKPLENGRSSNSANGADVTQGQDIISTFS